MLFFRKIFFVFFPGANSFHNKLSSAHPRLRRLQMIEFSSLDELSCIKGSEPLIEKIEGLQAFMRKNGMASSIKPYPKIKINCTEKRLSFELAILAATQPAASS